MGAISRIADSAIKTVQCKTPAGEHIFDFQIRRVTSRDLAVAGHSQLFALLTADDLVSIPDLSPEQVQRLAVERFANLSDVQRVKLSNNQDSLVCAGVVAIREPACEWEPCTVTSTGKTSASSGEINLNDLPGPIRKMLAEAVLGHSSDLGGLSSALDGFRCGAGANNGCSGQELRSSAT